MLLVKNIKSFMSLSYLNGYIQNFFLTQNQYNE